MENPQYTKKFLECWEKLTMDIKANPEQTSVIFRQRLQDLGPKERIQNLYQVYNKLEGKFTQFKPNPHQLEALDHILEYNNLAVLKCRQVGFSTLFNIYALDRALFDYWRTGLMAHNQETLKIIFETAKNSYFYFKEDWGHLYQPIEDHNNTTRLSWADTKASLTVAFSFRGLTVRFLHSSETAFTPGPRLSGSLAAVPETGQKVLESTPNGRGGFFYETWQSWKRLGFNAPYVGYFIPWQDHYPEIPDKYEPREKVDWTPEELVLKEQYNLQDYHLLWRRHKLEADCQNDTDVFDAEYPVDDISCFLAGSYHVVPKNVLAYQETFVQDPPHIGFLRVDNKKIAFSRDTKASLRIYRLPTPSQVYFGGVDTSSGTGHDPSVISMIDANGEQVAELVGFMEPDLLADEAYKLAQFYNQAFLCIEANNHGTGVILALKGKYFNLYRRQEFDTVTKKITSQIGFYTTGDKKLTIIDNMVAGLRDGTLKVRSNDLLNELSTFVHVVKKSKDGRSISTNRREAQSGCFDDRVMAYAFANEMKRSRPVSIANEITDPLTERSNFDPITGFPIGSSYGDDFVL